MRGDGRTLYLRRGDFGGGIPMHLKEHCADCADSLMSSDQIIFSITKGGKTLATQKTTWDKLKKQEGILLLSINEEQSKTLHLGLYGWTLQLLREGQSCMTLDSGILEVRL